MLNTGSHTAIQPLCAAHSSWYCHSLIPLLQAVLLLYISEITHFITYFHLPDINRTKHREIRKQISRNRRLWKGTNLEESAIKWKGWRIAAGCVRTMGVTEVLYQQVVLTCGWWGVSIILGQRAEACTDWFVGILQHFVSIVTIRPSQNDSHKNYRWFSQLTTIGRSLPKTRSFLCEVELTLNIISMNFMIRYV